MAGLRLYWLLQQGRASASSSEGGGWAESPHAARSHGGGQRG
jgi:hypothetical protein